MLSLDDAQRMIAAGVAKAQEMGQPTNVAVVDEGGNLLAFGRMAGAWLGSIGIAMDKAYSARAFDMSTEALAGMSQPGQPLFGIHATNHGRIVIFPGGIPVKQDGVVVGGVGASGGTPDQDAAVAQAALAAL